MCFVLIPMYAWNILGCTSWNKAAGHSCDSRTILSNYWGPQSSAPCAKSSVTNIT